MCPLEATNPEFCWIACSSLRIHQWTVAPVTSSDPADCECCRKYASCPDTVRRTFRSLSSRGFSQPSRALTVTPSGKRKYRVLRYRAIHRLGLGAPSGGDIVSCSALFPNNTTLV